MAAIMALHLLFTVASLDVALEAVLGTVIRYYYRDGISYWVAKSTSLGIVDTPTDAPRETLLLILTSRYYALSTFRTRKQLHD
jgi:hypothetical protein